MPAGRPTDYSPELAARICEQLSQGKSLRSVCKADDMPAASNVFLWLQRHSEFKEQYEVAKAESADALTDDMLEIADNADSDNVQVARLQVDTRKWLASKLKPKKYGEKITNEHSGIDGKPIEVDMSLSPSEAYLKFLNG
jgi:hypothetical protein